MWRGGDVLTLPRSAALQPIPLPEMSPKLRSAFRADNSTDLTGEDFAITASGRKTSKKRRENFTVGQTSPIGRVSSEGFQLACTVDIKRLHTPA